MEYVALSQYMIYLVPMKILVSEVIKSVCNYPGRLYLSTHSTVFEDNSGVVEVNQNYKMPVTTPGSKNIYAKYHWFREKIASGECSAKDVNGNEQKSDIFTKGL